MLASESSAKPGREGHIALDRDYARASVEQSPREHARPGSDVHDELIPRDSGVADESGCQPAATKEVLAASAPGGASSDGHGTSPWSLQSFYDSSISIVRVPLRSSQIRVSERTMRIMTAPHDRQRPTTPGACT